MENQISLIVEVTVVAEDNKENFGSRPRGTRPARESGHAPFGRPLFRDVTRQLVRKDALDAVSVLTAEG